MSRLQNNLNEIKRQKEEILTPDNVKKGVEYFGRVGTLEPSVEHSSNITLSEKTITSNGEYVAAEGTAFNKVNVQVLGDSGFMTPKIPAQVEVSLDTKTNYYPSSRLEVVSLPQIKIDDYSKVQYVGLPKFFTTTDTATPSTYFSIYRGSTLICNIGKNAPLVQTDPDDFGLDLDDDFDMDNMEEKIKPKFNVCTKTNKYWFYATEYIPNPNYEDFDIFDDDLEDLSDTADETITSITYVNTNKYGELLYASGGVNFKDAGGNTVTYDQLPQYIKDYIRLYDFTMSNLSGLAMITPDTNIRVSGGSTICSDAYIYAASCTDPNTGKWFKLPYLEYMHLLSLQQRAGSTSVDFTAAITSYSDTPEIYNGTEVYDIKEAYFAYTDDDNWYRYGTPNNGYKLVLGHSYFDSIKQTLKYVHYTDTNGMEVITSTTEETLNGAKLETYKSPVGVMSIFIIKQFTNTNNVYANSYKYIPSSYSAYIKDTIPLYSSSSSYTPYYWNTSKGNTAKMTFTTL